MVPVLMLGETGTGKEWLARRIARGGARADKPFVAVNCGALPRDLAESLLFGFERGAFTGAERRSPGKFAQADGGTLFLDEVGDLPPETQVKLLRALQDGEIDPIGAPGPVRVDIRVIAATHRDLRAEVAAGRFREDLFYRLHVFAIPVPPLRERADEIAGLARRFAARHLPGAELAPGALRRLLAHRWPGNIRELENAIRRAAVMAEGHVLQAGDFDLPDGWQGESALERPAGAAPPPDEDRSGEDAFPTLAQVERAHILRALQQCGGQPTRAARLLRIGRTTLYRKLKEYGLSLPESP
jgi:DNA-binding NtrC family response regulator